MAQIGLRVYDREIESMIDRGQIDEAIAHCKYILKDFPKHIETYRLLGKCYLESQRYVEAADILQRVLSVYPDDFISHIGMSIICEDENNLEKAIWHMERALEVQPSNSAVNSELRRLLTLRDGSEPTKVHLSQGAYIRMCVKSGLHEQAIAEAKSALSKEPQRIDLDLILAKMYSETGQQSNALDQLTIILNKLPYCYDANLLMTQILSSSNRSAEMKTYTDRLVAIDPYFAFIDSESPSPDLVLDDAVAIEKNEWQYDDDDTQRHTKILGTDWQDAKGPLATSGVTTKSFNQDTLPNDLSDENMIPSVEGVVLAGLAEQVIEQVETQDTEERTQEFKELRQEIASEPIAVSEIPEKQEPTPEVLPQESEPVGVEEKVDQELPDWMKSAGWVASDGQLEEAPVANISSAEPIQSSELPDWIKTMAPADTSPTPEELAEESEKMDLLEKILPDVHETTSEAAEVPSFPTEGSQIQESPESVVTFQTLFPPTETEPVTDLQPEITSEPQPVIASEVQSQDLPDWLNQDGISTEAEILSTVEPSPEPALPVWMSLEDQIEETRLEFPDQKSLASQAEQPVDIVDTAASGDQPEWLTSNQPEAFEKQPDLNIEGYQPMQAESISPAPDVFASTNRNVESIPTWLSSDEPAQSESLSFSDEEIPEWLRDEVPTSAEISSSADQTLISPAIEVTSQPVGSIEPEPISLEDSEIPDWLKEVNTDQSPVLSIPDEDILPEWARPSPIQDQQSSSPSDRVIDSFLQSAVSGVVINEEPEKPGTGSEQILDLSAVMQPTNQTENENLGLNSLLDQLSQGGYVNQNASDATIQESPDTQNAAGIASESVPVQISAEESPFVDSESISDEPRGDETLVSKPFIEYENQVAKESSIPPTDEIAEVLQVEAAEVTSDAEEMEIPVFNLEYGQVSPKADSSEQPMIDGAVLSQDIQDDTLDMTADIDIESWLNSLEEVNNSPVAVSTSAGNEQVEGFQDQVFQQMVSADEVPPLNQPVDLPLAETAPLVGLDEEEKSVDLSPLDELEEAGQFQGMPPVENLVATLATEPPSISETPSTSLDEVSASQPEPVLVESITSNEPKTFENMLDYANSSISEGNLEDAIKAFNNLIKKGNNLEETIQSLRSAVYRYPSEVIVWQALGDGYAKSNRLQEALDAYTKAEELII